MKIIPNFESNHIIGKSDVKKTQKNTSNGFGALFNDALEANKVETQKKTTPINAAMSSVIPPISEIILNQTELVDRIDRLINLLEEYQTRIADPDFSLKRIHPIVENMKIESSELKSKAPLLEGDNEIQKIINQTITTVSVEMYKFDRGEYIDS